MIDPQSPPCAVVASNPTQTQKLPNGVNVIHDFISNDEASTLLDEINKNTNAWSVQGYRHSRRVQRYTYPVATTATATATATATVNNNDTDNDRDTDAAAIAIPPSLHRLVQRLATTRKTTKSSSQLHDTDTDTDTDTALRVPYEIIVEELTHKDIPTTYPEEKFTMFEWRDHATCPCNNNNNNNNIKTRKQEDTRTTNISTCDCYVAQLCLMADAVQTFNLPTERDIECWSLQDHTDVFMKQHALCIKRNESLWDWRYSVAPTNSNTNKINNNKTTPNKVVLIKFVRMHVPLDHPARTQTPLHTLHFTAETRHINDANGNGIVPTKNGESTAPAKIPPTKDNTAVAFPPLSELLTIVITTSPIKSHPSTELLERTMETFQLAGMEFAKECPKVIVCDGCRIKQNDTNNNDCGEPLHSQQAATTVTRKHSNVKQALRNGIATSDQADNYRLFLETLQNKCEAQVAPFYSNTSVVELSTRHGYGFALRHALRHHVLTPYVCVIQHDRTFMRPTPLLEVVHAMYASKQKQKQHTNNNDNSIKYVGMNMRSNLTYRDIFLSKYGKLAHDVLRDLVLRPPELRLPADLWGPENGYSVQNMVYSSPRLKENIDALAQTYKGCKQYTEQQKWVQQLQHQQQQRQHQQQQPVEPKHRHHQLTLTPTLFWYDNTHVCDTAFYRDFIFEPKFRMVVKGGFVEEKVSPSIIKAADRLGLARGHAKFGCYILDDHSGRFFTGHLDGGAYIPVGDREKFSSEEQQRFHNKNSKSNSN